MKAVARFVAALLVGTIAAPGVFGFAPACCEHPKPRPRVVARPRPRVVGHQCEHDDVQEVMDTSKSSSSTTHRCTMCTIMPPAREERRLPKTSSVQLFVKSVSLAKISPRFSLPLVG